MLAVQEVCAPGLPAARALLRQLADDTGLRCLVPGPGGEAVPALCPGSRGYHLGLLWRDGIEPVPGSFHSRSADFWHALGWVTLDIGGPAIRHAVYHASPFGRKIRADQSEIVVAALARPGGRTPALVGADWNGESADRIHDPATGRWELYDAVDPAPQPGHRVPIVVVHGREDEAVPIVLSRSYVERTRARLVELAGADHFQLIEPGSAAWPAVVKGFDAYRKNR